MPLYNTTKQTPVAEKRQHMSKYFRRIDPLNTDECQCGKFDTRTVNAFVLLIIQYVSYLVTEPLAYNSFKIIRIGKYFFSLSFLYE